MDADLKQFLSVLAELTALRLGAYEDVEGSEDFEAGLVEVLRSLGAKLVDRGVL